jgi:nitrogen fixation protein
MKVRELIEALKAMPQGSEVYFYATDDSEHPIVVVEEDDYCGGDVARVVLRSQESDR